MLTKWQPVKLILFWGRGQSGRVPNLARRLGDVQQWYFMLPVSGCTLEHIPVEVRMWPWWCFLTWCIAFSLRHWLFHCSVFELMEPCVIANDDRLRQCCVTFTHKTKFAHPSVQTWTGRLKCSCRGTWSGPELHKNTTLKGNLNWGYWIFFFFFLNLGASLVASCVCILIIQVLTAVLQLYWGKNDSKAASWDGLQWTRCERCAVSISRHWWQSGRLHCACRSSTQGRGKKALTTKRNVKAPQKNCGSRGYN